MVRTLKGDPLLADGTHRLLTGGHKVRVDLTALSLTELQHLRSGIESEFVNREAGLAYAKCWLVPSAAVEVFVVRDSV